MQPQPNSPHEDAPPDLELVVATDETLWWTLVAQAARERADQERVRLDELMAQHRSLAQESTVGRGTVSRIGGKRVPIITDADALLAWTVKNRPEMTQPVLRPAWVEFVKRLTAESDGLPADPETGQLIPGARMGTSPRTIRVNCVPDARNDARRFLAGLRRLDEERSHDV